MKMLILFTCLLGLSLQAPAPQQQGAGPASIEIFLPYGIHGQAFASPQHPGIQLNPSSPQQNGLPGHASIEFLVPYGFPTQQSGVPTQLGQMFPQGYVKQKKLQAPGKASNEAHNSPDPAAQDTAQQPAENGPASIEILMPYGFQGQQFPMPQMPISNHPAGAHPSPQLPGHVSIEMLYPYSYPGQTAGYPQQYGPQSDAPAAAPLTPQHPAMPQHASVELLVPYGFPGQHQGHPQYPGSIFPSQGFLKHKIPQPPGARSIEILYPFGFGSQNPMLQFGNASPVVPQQLASQSPKAFPTAKPVQEEISQQKPIEMPIDGILKEAEQTVSPSAKTME
ncbi:calcium-binding protein P-like [Lepisosteus oculatus]|uniref:calcium-binding protein P-like n=1 Tax=Lepisosteus oculatus TaxID=7918 RepID=UPI00073FFAD9|nr:PREDICTED: calcium-binding protein P-like [Lepisosteus oculatus]